MKSQWQNFGERDFTQIILTFHLSDGQSEMLIERIHKQIFIVWHEAINGTEERGVKFGSPLELMFQQSSINCVIFLTWLRLFLLFSALKDEFFWKHVELNTSIIEAWHPIEHYYPSMSTQSGLEKTSTNFSKFVKISLFGHHMRYEKKLILGMCSNKLNYFYWHLINYRESCWETRGELNFW